MAKEVIEHFDKLGRPININDVVAFPSSNSLVIGRVVKLNPKMIGVEKVTNSSYKSSWKKYPSDLVLLEGADVTMYLLRN